MSSPKRPSHAPSATSSHQEKHVGEYIIMNRLGQGSFATVYKARHKDTQHKVAIKCVKRSKLTKKLLENLESEISILTSIRHENIVGLIECQKTESNIYLVMEYCSLGDLSHYIKEVRSDKLSKGPAGGLSERIIRHFLKQLANALKFLRSQNLIHRDIKPQNLLLLPSKGKTDDLPILKVADFGFARFLPNASLADTLCGSPLYMGPEILSYKKYDAKADLWSVGAVLYEMVTGRPPFRAQNHIELLKKIQENNDQIHFPDERLEHSEDSHHRRHRSSSGSSNDSTDSTAANEKEKERIGSDLKDLIRKLLKKNPVERISFEDFFQHPAVVDNIPERQQPSYARTHSLPQPLQQQQQQQQEQQQQQQQQQQSQPPLVDRRRSIAVTNRYSHTPPSPSSLQQQYRPSSYEPPPFAPLTPKSLPTESRRQPSSQPSQDMIPRSRRWSSNLERRSTFQMNPAMVTGTATRSPENGISPLYSKSSRTTIQSQDQPSQQPWLTSLSPSEPYDSSANRQQRRYGGGRDVEDMLQEYVVLDIRSIETNQFADALKATPGQNNERRLSRSPTHYNNHTTPTTTLPTSNYPKSNAVNIPSSSNNNTSQQPSLSPSSHSPLVRERKPSTGSSSAGSALAKAISKASTRLFGTSNPSSSAASSPPKDPHQQQQQQQQAYYSTSHPPHGFMSQDTHSLTHTTAHQTTAVPIGKGYHPPSSSPVENMASSPSPTFPSSTLRSHPSQHPSIYHYYPYERRLHHHRSNSRHYRSMKRIERLACMAHAVAKYADQKYDALYIKKNQPPESTATTTSTTIDLLSEEAIALYVKALALLEKGLSIAQQFWQQLVHHPTRSTSSRQRHRRNSLEEEGEEEGIHQANIDIEEEEEEEERQIMSQLNEAVQWMRDRFNTCLDRAESIKMDESETTTTMVTEQCIVEKLLYDRALEMSRAAAVHELVGENIHECEQDYQTAIWMLEAILQVQQQQQQRSSEDGTATAEDMVTEDDDGTTTTATTIEEEDKQIIKKLIESIRHRITVLRKKLAQDSFK